MKKFTYVDLFFCMAFLTLTIMLWNSFTARCPLCEASLDPNQWYIWDIEDGRFAPVDSISTTRPETLPLLLRPSNRRDIQRPLRALPRRRPSRARHRRHPDAISRPGL